MASISLPRVLHPRKTSLEIERENFEKTQQTVLKKAVNPIEGPVKQKHVRSAIIGTFHTQGMVTFWTIAIKLPAMDDRIVAWKLCHVVHKVLREGHPLCLVHSQRHRRDLDEIGKLWVHLRDEYGKMIRLYTLLLMTKLDFHRRNPRFPGHLGVTPEELDSIGGNDINHYFELSVEMFDYLDSILDLQAAVFGSLNMAKSNSMTCAGQCRLCPLIPCIQDASKLYDYCVKILFKLHYVLPPDTLTGHRERFYKQFKKLKQFYQSTSTLQYFKDLIAIPPLPEHPPNFLIQSDLRMYITQEVVVPQEEIDDEPAEGSLIDTTDTGDILDNNSHNSSSPNPAHQEMIAEKEFLQAQCDKLSADMTILISKNRKDMEKLQNKIIGLETELATKDSELVQERQVKEDLMNQAFTVAQSQDSEQKVKDEKFNKLKELYVKLRDSHIEKLREVADIGKKLQLSEKNIADMEQSRLEAENKLKEITQQFEEFKRGNNESSEELESLRRDKELFNMETEILKKSVADAYKERDDLKLELSNFLKEKEEFRKKSEEISFKLMECEHHIENLRKENEINVKEVVCKCIQSSEDLLKNAIHEVDNPAVTALTCNPDYLKSLTKGCIDCVRSSLNISYQDHAFVVIVASKIAHQNSVYILQGKATSNTSPDINFGERMSDTCKELGEIILKVLNTMKNCEDTSDFVSKAIEKLEEVAKLSDDISASLLGAKVENLADMLENELTAMDKAIEEAAKRIQDMLTQSRVKDSGIKLEVNSKILDSCTNLMEAIRLLVKKSRLLQNEIVGQGRGTASAKEFYKRNHQWTDGFISAAKAVAVAAQFLLTSADKVVTSNGKLEQLIVAAQEISASTAQLVVASRVKADRKSDNLKQLTQASKGVTTATGTVVATVKDCGQLIDETEELDTSKITLHQAKRLEMEAQVRVLELEKELEQQRLHLSALRRHHYQLADDNDA